MSVIGEMKDEEIWHLEVEIARLLKENKKLRKKLRKKENH
jgi:hypothetical protein